MRFRHAALGVTLGAGFVLVFSSISQLHLHHEAVEEAGLKQGSHAQLTRHSAVPTAATAAVKAVPTPGPRTMAGKPGLHMAFSKLLNDGGLHMDPEEFLPADPLTPAEAARLVSDAQCIQRGMQKKCLFQNLMVHKNTFTFLGSKGEGKYPSPIYPADGLVGPLKQYHKYEGHRIRKQKEGDCVRLVRRPTVFLFRMSGHSTYHLWENNLGPFYQTLQQFPSVSRELNDVTKLLVAFVDLKPTKGPKAPYLLDTLLQSFTDLPLVNASRILRKTCFEKAVVGVASNSFDHAKLLRAMQLHVAGTTPEPLPPHPKVIFVSRNHKSVVRGRKISNEPEVVAALNATVLNRTGSPVEYLHMQDYTYQEQVKKTIASQVLIGPHGGGIANCIWMQKGSVAMEMAAPAGRDLFNLYHSMCKRSKISHLSFVAEPDPADVELPDSAFNNNRRLFSNLKISPQKMVAEANRALDVYYKNYAASKKQ